MMIYTKAVVEQWVRKCVKNIGRFLYSTVRSNGAKSIRQSNVKLKCSTR